MVNPQSEITSAAEKNRIAVVVGGGPTGALTALYLAQMGWQVSVYERRSAQTQASTHRRSFNIVLNNRGLKALEAIGFQLPPEQHVCLQGNVRHTPKGAALSQQFKGSVSVDRNVLAQSLIDAGQQRFPENIQYHFDRTFVKLDMQGQTAWFQGPQEQHQQTFDLLIGADGVFSTVRDAIKAQIAEFEVRQHRDNMMYKICDLGLAQNLPGATAEWAHTFHTWPQAPITLLAPPSTDGALKGILILPQAGEITYEKVQTEQDVSNLFQAKFPDIFPDLEQTGLPPTFAPDLLSQKAAYGGITTTCNRFEVNDCVVLLGDAAHSIWPSLGQGCNAALESCRIFAEVLAQKQGNLSQALPAYTIVRKPDVEAVAQLSEIGFGGNKRAASTLFIAKVLILVLLHKLLPIWFRKYALFQLGDAEVPYSHIWRQVQSQDRQVMGILAILVGIVPLCWIVFQVIG